MKKRKKSRLAKDLDTIANMTKFEKNFPELAEKAKEERKKKRKKPERKNPDLGPKIRVAWGQLSKNQRKAVIQVAQAIGTGFSMLAEGVHSDKSWKEFTDPMVLVNESYTNVDVTLPPDDDWQDAKSNGKEVNTNQVFDTGGVMEVVVFALILQVLHRTTK